MKNIRTTHGFEIKRDGEGHDEVLNPHIKINDHPDIGKIFTIMPVDTISAKWHNKTGEIIEVNRCAILKRNKSGNLRYKGSYIGYSVVMKDFFSDTTKKTLHTAFKGNQIKICY